MKPFNLKKALAGEKVVTGAGKEVTELTYFKTIYGDYKVRAVIEGELDSFTEEGQWETNGKNEKRDLFMAPVLHTKYLLIIPERHGFDSVEELKAANPEFPLMGDTRRIIEINWEE